MAKHYRFEALVNTVAPDLYRFGYWLSGSREQAEDLVQETLVRAWRSLDQLRDEDSARSWLLTILRREHARQYERKRLEQVDFDSLQGADLGRTATSEDPQIGELREQMMKLPAQFREPLVLQVLMGYSTQEIASVMEISQGAVLTRLCRARRQLRADLDPADRQAEEVQA